MPSLSRLGGESLAPCTATGQVRLGLFAPPEQRETEGGFQVTVVQNLLVHTHCVVVAGLVWSAGSTGLDWWLGGWRNTQLLSSSVAC